MANVFMSPTGEIYELKYIEYPSYGAWGNVGK